MKDIQITTEFTPNPDSLKFNVSVPVCTRGAVHFASAAEAEKSPLAVELFRIKYVKEVMIGPDHVTVIRNEKAQTTGPVIPLVTAAIKAHLTCGQTSPKVCEQCADVENPGNEIERKIIEILEEQIRPALARDGETPFSAGSRTGS